MGAMAEIKRRAAEIDAELAAQQPAPEEAAAPAISSTTEPAPEAPREQSFLEKWIGPGSHLDSMVQGGFNSLTMNLMDEASAGLGTLGGRSYEEGLEQERASTASAKEAHPWAYGGGELAGAIAPALATGGASAGTSLLGAAGKAALSGAAQSGASAFGEGEGMEDRLSRAGTAAAIGGVTGGVLGGVTRAVTKGGKVAAANAARKSTNEFKAAEKEAYDAVKAADVVYEPQALKNVAQDMKKKVSDGVFDPVANKDDAKIAKLITQFERIVDPSTRKGAKKALAAGQPPPDSLMTIGRIERFRQTLKDQFIPSKPGFNHRLKLLEESLDSGIATNPEGQKLVTLARSATRQRVQSDILDKVVKKVEDQTASTYSGTNLNNKYRQAFTQIINNPKLANNFEKPQLDAMEQLVVKQNVMADIVRKVGALSPLRGGLMSTLNLGMSALVHPGFLGVGAAAEVARRAGDKMTRNAVEGVRNQVAGNVVGPISTQAPAAATGLTAGLSSMLGSQMGGGTPESQEQAPEQAGYVPPEGYMSPLEQMVRGQMGQ